MSIKAQPQSRNLSCVRYYKQLG